MSEPIVHNHAYKHGLSKVEILHAWRNAYASQVRKGHWPPQHLAIGPSRAGYDIQFVAVWNDDEGRWLIFHAMRATRVVRRELGLL